MRLTYLIPIRVSVAIGAVWCYHECVLIDCGSLYNFLHIETFWKFRCNADFFGLLLFRCNNRLHVRF